MAPSRPQVFSLVVIRPSGVDGQRFTLDDRDYCVLGSHEDCDIRIHSKGVADLHTLIRIDGGVTPRIFGLDKQLPTVVPGRKLALLKSESDSPEPYHVLNNGELFYVGERAFRFESERCVPPGTSPDESMEKLWLDKNSAKKIKPKRSRVDKAANLPRGSKTTPSKKSARRRQRRSSMIVNDLAEFFTKSSESASSPDTLHQVLSPGAGNDVPSNSDRTASVCNQAPLDNTLPAVNMQPMNAPILAIGGAPVNVQYEKVPCEHAESGNSTSRKANRQSANDKVPTGMSIKRTVGPAKNDPPACVTPQRSRTNTSTPVPATPGNSSRGGTASQEVNSFQSARRRSLKPSTPAPGNDQTPKRVVRAASNRKPPASAQRRLVPAVELPQTPQRPPKRRGIEAHSARTTQTGPRRIAPRSTFNAGSTAAAIATPTRFPVIPSTTGITKQPASGRRKIFSEQKPTVKHGSVRKGASASKSTSAKMSAAVRQELVSKRLAMGLSALPKPHEEQVVMTASTSELMELPGIASVPDASKGGSQGLVQPGTVNKENEICGKGIPASPPRYKTAAKSVEEVSMTNRVPQVSEASATRSPLSPTTNSLKSFPVTQKAVPNSSPVIKNVPKSSPTAQKIPKSTPVVKSIGKNTRSSTAARGVSSIRRSVLFASTIELGAGPHYSPFAKTPMARRPTSPGTPNLMQDDMPPRKLNLLPKPSPSGPTTKDDAAPDRVLGLPPSTPLARLGKFYYNTRPSVPLITAPPLNESSHQEGSSAMEIQVVRPSEDNTKATSNRTSVGEGISSLWQRFRGRTTEDSEELHEDAADAEDVEDDAKEIAEDAAEDATENLAEDVVENAEACNASPGLNESDGAGSLNAGNLSTTGNPTDSANADEAEAANVEMDIDGMNDAAEFDDAAVSEDAALSDRTVDTQCKARTSTNSAMESVMDVEVAAPKDNLANGVVTGGEDTVLGLKPEDDDMCDIPTDAEVVRGPLSEDAVCGTNRHRSSILGRMYSAAVSVACSPGHSLFRSARKAPESAGKPSHARRHASYEPLAKKYGSSKSLANKALFNEDCAGDDEQAQPTGDLEMAAEEIVDDTRESLGPRLTSAQDENLTSKDQVVDEQGGPCETDLEPERLFSDENVETQLKDSPAVMDEIRGAEDKPDFEKWRVKELKEYLTGLGINVKGLQKAGLVCLATKHMSPGDSFRPADNDMSSVDNFTKESAPDSRDEKLTAAWDEPQNSIIGDESSEKEAITEATTNFSTWTVKELREYLGGLDIVTKARKKVDLVALAERSISPAESGPTNSEITKQMPVHEEVSKDTDVDRTVSVCAGDGDTDLRELLQSLTVVQLRERLSISGLDTKGRKAQLIDRLLSGASEAEDAESAIESHEASNVPSQASLSRAEYEAMTVTQLQVVMDELQLDSSGRPKKADRINLILQAQNISDANTNVVPMDVNIEDPQEEPDSPSSWTVAALRSELQKRGANTNGRKAELVRRVKAEHTDTQTNPATPEKSPVHERANEVDIGKLTVVQLRALLKDQGKCQAGKKTVLIGRAEALKVRSRRNAEDKCEKCKTGSQCNAR